MIEEKSSDPKSKPARYNEWSKNSWNPVKGCTRVDKACMNCYAERDSAREKEKEKTPGRAGYFHVIQDGRWNGEVFLDEAVLNKPEKWKKPQWGIFVCSMSDLFHPNVSDEYIQRVFDVMRRVDRHTYIVLTKRPQRFSLIKHYPENVILSVSVGHAGALDFVNYLRDTDATTKFLSIEPLLEDLPGLDLTGIDWVAVGGESGTRSDLIRPTHPAWVRNIRDKCIASGVAFHFKGWQAWLPEDHIQYTDDKFQASFNPYRQPCWRWDDGLISYFVRNRGVCESLDGTSWTQRPAGRKQPEVEVVAEVKER